jgi:hypothetical protein
MAGIAGTDYKRRSCKVAPATKEKATQNYHSQHI